MGASLKGQMIFEFVVAAILFIGIVFYIMTVLNGSINSQVMGFQRNHLQSEALRVSEVLLHSPGVWEEGQMVSPGIESSWPTIDDSKLAGLASYCADSANLARMTMLLGLGGTRGESERLLLRMSDAKSTFLNCGFGTQYGDMGYAQRIAFSPSHGPVRLEVYVW
jgi:hypothetical protein